MFAQFELKELKRRQEEEEEERLRREEEARQAELQQQQIRQSPQDTTDRLVLAPYYITNLVPCH